MLIYFAVVVVIVSFLGRIFKSSLFPKHFCRNMRLLLYSSCFSSFGMQSSVYFCDNFNTPIATATTTAAAVNNRFSTSSYLCISKQMLLPTRHCSCLHIFATYPDNYDYKQMANANNCDEEKTRRNFLF